MKSKLKFVGGFYMQVTISLATAFLVFFSEAVLAQKHDFLNVKAGWEHIGSRDRGMSPLLYSGNGIYLGLGWERTSDRRVTEIEFDLSRGNQRNKYEAPIGYSRGNLQIATFYSRRKNNGEALLKWGWLINNTFSHRRNSSFVNFNDHYEYFSNIGPALRFTIPFKLNGREVQVMASGYLQLLGVMIRPSYTSSFPEGFLREQSSMMRNLVHSFQLIHPMNAVNFGFKPRLVYPLKSGNKLSVVYDYEFYRLNSSNPVAQSGGVWYISLSTRL